jgi:dTDP-glucose 4,6-dehydratase
MAQPPLCQPPLPRPDLELILQRTAPLWDELRNRRIFITGGTGFFGIWLLESLLHIDRALGLNVRATVLTRRPAAFASRVPHIASAAAITLHQGDITSFAYPEGEFSCVIHAATEVSSVSGTSVVGLTSIYEGTAHVLRFAATHGTHKFLLTSSGAVYGRQPTDITHLSEDATCAPATTDLASGYGEGKRVSELLCAFQAVSHPGIEYKIARCFAFAGPGLALDANFAIGNFIADVQHCRPVYITGDGTAVRSYLYAADLAIWLWTILFSGPSLTPINVGSEEAISIAELASKITGLLRPGFPVILGKQPPTNYVPLRYVPSTAKAREILSLHPTIGLDESILRMAAWHGITPLQKFPS